MLASIEAHRALKEGFVKTTPELPGLGGTREPAGIVPGLTADSVPFRIGTTKIPEGLSTRLLSEKRRGSRRWLERGYGRRRGSRRSRCNRPGHGRPSHSCSDSALFIR